MKLKNLSLSTIGLLQALGAVIYCGLVGEFFVMMEKISSEPPKILAITTILFLLVFSAAVTGLLVFGYPALLALDKKIKEALTILAYTFLYGLLIIFLILFFIVYIE